MSFRVMLNFSPRLSHPQKDLSARPVQCVDRWSAAAQGIITRPSLLEAKAFSAGLHPAEEHMRGDVQSGAVGIAKTAIGGCHAGADSA